jgi:hypothetical protein
MATLSALVLNLLFNILGGADRAAHTTPATSIEDQGRQRLPPLSPAVTA